MNRRIDDEAHELELRGAVKLEVSRNRSATSGMTAFHRIETVDGQPLVTTVALFITDALWEQLGEPVRLDLTMEPGR